MPSYILRDIDPNLWQAFKERAASEGRPLRWIIFQLIASYIKRGMPK